MKTKRTPTRAGTLYAVPLTDGSFGIIQAAEAMAVNITYVVLFANRFLTLPQIPPQLSKYEIIALLATWRQDLERSTWPVIDELPLLLRKKDFPNEKLAANGYVGAKHYDSGILVDFLCAYHGLIPWNVMHKENYYDLMLAPGIPRPASAVMLDSDARKAYRKEHYGVDHE